MKITAVMTGLLLLIAPDLYAVFADEKVDSADKGGESAIFRDDFNELNKTEWKITGFAGGVSVKDGFLKLKTSGGPSEAIMITSSKEFIYASFEMRLRLSRIGAGTNNYLGFMSRSTWNDPTAQSCAWLLNSSAEVFQLFTMKESGPNSVVVSPKIEAGQWYTVKIDWTPNAVELYLDGKLVGAVRKAESIPAEAMPVVMDLFANDKTPLEMDIDWLTVKGRQKNPAEEKLAEVSSSIPLPTQVAAQPANLPDRAPSVTLVKDGAILENKYYKYVLNFAGEPKLTSLENKFLSGSRELLAAPSRLFMLHAGKMTCRNKSFKLLSCSREEKSDSCLLHTKWQSTDLPAVEFTVTFEVDNSPELSQQIALANRGNAEIAASISCPVLEHIKIGDKIEDDALFYPSETGICGMADYDFRGIYGYSLWMQVMAVFDPAAGGGLYTMAKDSGGNAKILMIRRKSKLDRRPPAYSEIWWHSQAPDGKIYDSLPGSSMIFKTLDFQLKPGQQGTVPTMITGVHPGDWHAPLKAYGSFVRNWFKHSKKVPQWYMDSFAYVSGHPSSGLHLLNQVHDTSSNGGGFYDNAKKQYRYADLMKTAERNSIMEFAFWWDYNCATPGNESSYAGDYISGMKFGDYDYPQRRGGQALLKAEVAKIHANGGRLMLYFYPEAVSFESKVFKEYGMALAAMTSPGKYEPRFGAEGKSCNYCVYTPEFRKYFSTLIADKVKGVGADGCRLDVLSYLFPCFNPAHEHYDGTFRSAVPAEQLNELLKSCQTAIREANPEGVLTTEHAGSDFLTQNTDGYLAQNKAWFGIPEFKSFRGFNQYRLNFMRFLFPEVKSIMAGLGFSVDESVQIGLFNASALSIMPPSGVLTFDSLRENGDAVNSGLMPEPYIETLVEHVYANYFPGKTKRLWTIYNRSGKQLSEQDLLEIPAADKVHYVEVINDVAVTAQAAGNRLTRLSLPVGSEKTAVVVELPEVLKADIENGKLYVSLAEPFASQTDISIQTARAGQDLPGMRHEQKLENGQAVLDIPAGKGNIIVKVLEGYYLLDELILKQ